MSKPALWDRPKKKRKLTDRARDWVPHLAIDMPGYMHVQVQRALVRAYKRGRDEERKGVAQ